MLLVFGSDQALWSPNIKQAWVKSPRSHIILGSVWTQYGGAIYVRNTMVISGLEE